MVLPEAPGGRLTEKSDIELSLSRCRVEKLGAAFFVFYVNAGPPRVYDEESWRGGREMRNVHRNDKEHQREELQVLREAQETAAHLQRLLKQRRDKAVKATPVIATLFMTRTYNKVQTPRG